MPPGRSSPSFPSGGNFATGRFRHLPRSSLPVPTSSPRGRHSALTLGFPRESPAGGRRAHRALPPGMVPRWPREVSEGPFYLSLPITVLPRGGSTLQSTSSSEGESRRGAHGAGPPQERCTSAPGRVSVDPSPDENGRPSTRLLASRPAVRPLGRRLTAARTFFPHLWATSPRKPRVSVAPGRGVTRERVKNESSRFRGETSDKGPSLLSSPGKV